MEGIVRGCGIMKVTIIGSGSMGSLLIEKVLKLGHEIIGVYGHQNRGNFPNLYFSDNIPNLIDKADVVILAIPPEYNLQWIEQALIQHKPIYVEKPMTDNYANALTIQKMVNTEKGFLMAGHCLCYSENIEQFSNQGNYLCSVVNRRQPSIPARMNEFWNVGVHYIALCDILGVLDVDIHFVFSEKIKHGKLDVSFYNGEQWTEWGIVGDIYMNEMKHFFDCINSGSTPLTNVDHAVRCIKEVDRKYGLIYPNDLYGRAW
jgi:hypothetical protein